MDKRSMCIGFALVSLLLVFSQSVSAQTPSPGKPTTAVTSMDANGMVSVKASVSVPISNETMKMRNSMLISAVVSFLNSGPNVFKTQQSDQPTVKTKIINQINNDTQNVEGIEATNAIVGVEMIKALKTLVSSSSKPNQDSSITLDINSTCKPLTPRLVSCENAITLKP